MATSATYLSHREDSNASETNALSSLLYFQKNLFASLQCLLFKCTKLQIQTYIRFYSRIQTHANTRNYLGIAVIWLYCISIGSIKFSEERGVHIITRGVDAYLSDVHHWNPNEYDFLITDLRYY